MKVTEETTLGELAEMLRSLPYGTRLHLGANKPGDFTAIIEPPMAVPRARHRTISHKNRIADAIGAAFAEYAAALLKETSDAG